LKKDSNIIDKVQRELRSLYHDFSAFAHISMETYRRDWDNPDYYPYSMDYAYNKKKFHSTLEKIWQVIDLIASIMLLMCSRFYGYKSPHEYLEAMKNFYKNRRYNRTKNFIKHVNSTPIRGKVSTVFSLL